MRYMCKETDFFVYRVCGNHREFALRVCKNIEFVCITYVSVSCVYVYKLSVVSISCYTMITK